MDKEIRPGCFEPDKKGVCLKAVECDFATECLSAGVFEIRVDMSATRDDPPGYARMEGGLPRSR